MNKYIEHGVSIAWSITVPTLGIYFVDGFHGPSFVVGVVGFMLLDIWHKYARGQTIFNK